MDPKRFDPSKFTISWTKPLPVLLLLDVSGSMNEIVSAPLAQTGPLWESKDKGTSRIQVLNQAVVEMLASFAREEGLEHEFLVSVITFGDQVTVHLAPTKASHVSWQPLLAAGQTPLGEALNLAKRLLEDKERTPPRAYRPVVVLVSDGKPTDRWEASLESFAGTGRSAKCDRVAVAIGAGADEQMLKKFIAGTPNPLFYASDAKQILETFHRVTLSVTVRSRAKDPNLIPGLAQAPSAAAPARCLAGNEAQKRPASNDDDGYW